MSYVQLIVLGLQLINKLVDWGLQNKYIKQGVNEEINRALAEIVRKVGVARDVEAHVDSLTDDDVDKLLRELGGTDATDSKR